LLRAPKTGPAWVQAFTWAALMDGLGRGGDLRRTALVLDENIECRRREPELLAALRELTTKEKVSRAKMESGVPRTITLLGPAVVIDCMLTDTRLRRVPRLRSAFVAIGIRSLPPTIPRYTLPRPHRQHAPGKVPAQRTRVTRWRPKHCPARPDVGRFRALRCGGILPALTARSRRA